MENEVGWGFAKWAGGSAKFWNLRFEVSKKKDVFPTEPWNQIAEMFLQIYITLGYNEENGVLTSAVACWSENFFFWITLLLTSSGIWIGFANLVGHMDRGLVLLTTFVNPRLFLFTGCEPKRSYGSRVVLVDSIWIGEVVNSSRVWTLAQVLHSSGGRMFCGRWRREISMTMLIPPLSWSSSLTSCSGLIESFVLNLKL